MRILGGLRRHHTPLGVPGGFVNTSMAGGAGGSTTLVPPATSMGTSVAFHGPSGIPCYHPQDVTLGRATWSVGHHGEVFGVTATEAYVPRMTDQEYTPEDDPGSFVGEDWEEGTLGVEAFQELPGNHHGRACDNHYRVPLTTQEQSYANHESQEEQVAAAAGGPSSTDPLAAGGSRWGL